MLHLTPSKREQMAIDRERAKEWLHALPAYLNREVGLPVESVKVLTFPARTEATS